MPYRTEGNQESKAIGNLYCDKNHKGNWEFWETMAISNRGEWGIVGKRWQSWGISNWETLGIRNWQSGESSGNPAIQGIFRGILRQFRESTGNLAMRAILGNAYM